MPRETNERIRQTLKDEAREISTELDRCFKQEREISDKITLLRNRQAAINAKLYTPAMPSTLPVNRED